MQHKPNLSPLSSTGLNMKSPLQLFSEADRKKLTNDLNSPSAHQRLKAIAAFKIVSKERKRYSMFDIPHEEQEIVSAKELEEVARTKTIQEVMRAVVAYVEVRSGIDDRTDGIKSVLRALGAKISEKICKSTTHVIFKDGLLSTYQKAVKMNIPIVSVLWIEACKKHLILAEPKDFEIFNKHRYDYPELYKKMRRPKVMSVSGIDSSSPVSNAVLKPLRFYTPIAASIGKELREFSNKLEQVLAEADEPEEEIKTPVMENKPVAKCYTEPIKRVDKRKTICVLPQTKNDSLLSLNSKMWTLAMQNLKQLKSSPKEEKPESVTTPLTKVAINPRRKTLFTPRADFFDSLDSDDDNDKTPVNEVKSAVKRRTLFTPGQELKTDCDATPKVEAAPRRRTLFTPNPDFTADLFKTMKTEIASVGTPITQAKSTNRRKTLYTPQSELNSAATNQRALHCKTEPRRLLASTKTSASIHEIKSKAVAKVDTGLSKLKSTAAASISATPVKAVGPLALAKTPSSSVAKRKLDDGLKENTPPKRPHLKQSLTTPRQIGGSKGFAGFGKLNPGIHIDLVSPPPTKRRRTLLPAPTDKRFAL